ncbi:hypothetical protein N7532_000309 [Penicillium argentinense]|uniref:Uncharacterized protein n=1 Tax=Penicillium argentinense TaxID=1131581 RepID=A0A9W9G5A0_9EURO|nr:uncharacterized protein N7532_000309 [Penicillium argentinense]KAJ5112264.1 hypothetical protein N7532_000309 [Penicillium argentinense]
MGHPTDDPSRSRDDPPTSSSLSLHTLEDTTDLPPPYTDEPELAPAQPTPHSTASHFTRPLILIDSAYHLPGAAEIRPEDKRAATTSSILSRDAETLYRAIRRQMKLPPRPILSVRGTHSESSNDGKKKQNNTVTDFQFQLDLAETMLTGWEAGQGDGIANWFTAYVNKDNDEMLAYRGGRLRSRAHTPKSAKYGAIALEDDSDARLIGADAEAGSESLSAVDREHHVLKHIDADLKMWCERYCQDPTPVKSFTLHRHLKAFNKKTFTNALETHIRDLNYRGSVTFDQFSAHGSVTVYSPHWINRLRLNRFVWWTVVILQLWIITWPIIWLMEKRYEVASTQWNAALESDVTTGLRNCYAQGRDESQLAAFWAPAVKQAAWTRRQGDCALLTRIDAERVQGLTTEQLLGLRENESAAEIERRERVNRGEGGFVDGIIGLARGVSEIHQDYRLRMGWGGSS